jgi:hypothetical protein
VLAVICPKSVTSSGIVLAAVSGGARVCEAPLGVGIAFAALGFLFGIIEAAACLKLDCIEVMVCLIELSLASLEAVSSAFSRPSSLSSKKVGVGGSSSSFEISRLPTLRIVFRVSWLNWDFNARRFADIGKRPVCSCSFLSISLGIAGTRSSTACVTCTVRGALE